MLSSPLIADNLQMLAELALRHAFSRFRASRRLLAYGPNLSFFQKTVLIARPRRQRDWPRAVGRCSGGPDTCRRDRRPGESKPGQAWPLRCLSGGARTLRLCNPDAKHGGGRRVGAGVQLLPQHRLVGDRAGPVSRVVVVFGLVEATPCAR
jgi:hypothetical protein